jgi:alpha-glucosidase
VPAANGVAGSVFIPMNTGSLLTDPSQNLSTDWWHSAVVYQLYVRSFADANGDGIGDLEGIIGKLDYLADLGIDAIWLNPCYPSPQADHGYDVADYFNIEPDYGDLETFDRLVAQAKARNIRILMDVVPNHCSTAHARFQAALAAGPGSPEREWFYFRDGKGPGGKEAPNNWPAWFGGSAWTRTTNADGTPGQWYLHLFTPDQPDFNWNHEPVRQHFDEMLRFWFDRGVDGFRIDAPCVAGKTPGLPDMEPIPPGTPATAAAGMNPHVNHRPEVHEMFARWRAVTNAYEAERPDRKLVFVGETYAPTLEQVSSYVGETELHSTFYFDLLLNNWQAPRWQRSLDDLIHSYRNGVRFAVTLNNHDAQRTVTRYGHADAHLDSSFTFNNLINSHEPVDVEVGTQRARAATLFMLALPLPVFLYAGEELGLPEVLDLPEDSLQDPIWERSGRTERGRDGCRVPLPWTSDRATNFGFSGNPSTTSTDPSAKGTWLPQPRNWGQYNAQDQFTNQNSMHSLYREALRIRASLTSATDITLRSFGENGKDLVAFEREGLLCVFNVGAQAQDLPDGLGQLILSSHSEATASRLPVNAAIWLKP